MGAGKGVPGPSTPYGWRTSLAYANASDELDSAERSSGDDPADRSPYEDAEGVEIVCGASETRGEGCGRPYYLSFVKFHGGEEVDPSRTCRSISLADGVPH